MQKWTFRQKEEAQKKLQRILKIIQNDKCLNTILSNSYLDNDEDFAYWPENPDQLRWLSLNQTHLFIHYWMDDINKDLKERIEKERLSYEREQKLKKILK